MDMLHVSQACKQGDGACQLTSSYLRGGGSYVVKLPMVDKKKIDVHTPTTFTARFAQDTT